MNINFFRVRKYKIEKLWLILLFAFSMAILLIIISFYIVFGNSKNKYINKDVFECNSYYTKFNVTVFSNKNQNTYQMEEFFCKDGQNKKYRFNTINNELNYSYIINNNKYYISSDAQISKIDNYDSLLDINNIMSLSNFIELYNYLREHQNNTKIKNKIKIEENKKDNITLYRIFFEDIKNNDEKIFEIYNIFKISSIELTIDDNKPIEYVIYNDNKCALFDITYIESEINKKIDEKVFSF